MARKKKKVVATSGDTEVLVNYNAQRQILISYDGGPVLQKTMHVLPSTMASQSSSLPPCYAPSIVVPRPHALPHSDLHNEKPSASTNAPQTAESFEDTEQTRTRRAQLLAEYSENFALVARLLIAKEADPRIGHPCECGHAPRQVRCSSCMQMAPLCSSCWVDQHKYQPLHWAEVWDDSRGYFSRQDISTGTEPLLMTLVDVNGIHATRVSFCQCMGHSKWRQLFDANFFSATIDQPQTAFTFELLRQWMILNLQSKITAHHFVAALRRQTDNVFTGNIPDILNQFRFVARIWPLFVAEKRSGYFHGDGMKQCFPFRPVDDLRNSCIVCPEDGVNMEAGWEHTPAHLRHLHSRRWCVDGNNKTGNYAKNNDLNDTSLFLGRAYMPSEQRFERYQQSVPQLQKEKATCNHLKVANGANSAKYKNQRISGNLHVQCDHGVVLSSVDMALGERLSIYDYALNLAIEARPFRSGTLPDLVISYDNTCGAVANIHSRWHKYFPEKSHIIDNARFTIPACHVRNHVEGCDYLYCYMYKPNTGHFHGETVEATWAVFNELGPSVLQMSPGHRIDTLITHYGDWNWRKAVSMSQHLYKDLEEAKIQYVSKRDHFAGLCDLFESKVITWNTMDRSPKIDPRQKKNVNSVYSHNNEKAPTMKSLVDTLMRSDDTVVISTGTANVGSVATWLKEGLTILQLQSRIQSLARTCGDKPSKELQGRRTKLTTRIEKWRKLQQQYMQSIGLDRMAPNTEIPENTPLQLPSDFSPSERQKHHLVDLGSKQAQMLEFALGDIVHLLQTTVKTLSAAYERKYKYARGQDANTRANEGIRTIENKRNMLIADYNLFRQKLDTLDSLDDAKWPSMTIHDTFRKPTEKRRSPGDSRVMDGSLWRMTTNGHSGAHSQIAGGLIFGDSDNDLPASHENAEELIFDTRNITYGGTKMSSRRQAHSAPGHANGSMPFKEKSVLDGGNDLDTDVSASKRDGWIWQHGSLKNMTPEELQRWEDQSDSIHWFRAEADLERWQEQLEIKHAEFLRLIASFTKYRDAWDYVSAHFSPTPGHRAYALEHRDMFDSLRIDAEEKFRSCALPFLRCSISGNTLHDRVQLWRAEEEKLFKFNRWASRPDFHDPTTLKYGGDIREAVDDYLSAESSATKRKFDEI
ncbi:hypothetical protein C8R42DRAFT_725564 [Lentinula raphanica]|nr:hypothetical protein C8R42DRAFT_725564 [Lentinula raphanica]